MIDEVIHATRGSHAARPHAARRAAHRLGWWLMIGLSVLPFVCDQPSSEAVVSKTDKQRLETGDTNQGGGTISTSKYRLSGTIGGSFSTLQKSSTSTKGLQTGDLAIAAGSTKQPVNQLDITVLNAKTGPLGTSITPRTWQQDADPIFIWEPPAIGLSLAGYSYAVDAEPDDVVDTTGTSWDVSLDSIRKLVDGVHTFWVKAINSAGASGKAASFEIWVDSTPPVIGTYTPAQGALVATITPTITATVTDAHSGVDVSSLELVVNGVSVSTSYDAATGTMTAVGSGFHEGPDNLLKLRAHDLAGNTTDWQLWSVTVDTIPPTGSLLINGGASQTTSAYVTLSLSASDATSGVVSMLLSNDPVINFVEEPFSSVREQWLLNTVRGPQHVYVKFKDGAGNISQVLSDDIELVLLAPETLIVSGPAGATPERTAQFTFSCPEGGCVFSYTFDTEPWSAWSAETSATKADLVYGNHYFMVKAAKESNGIPGIQPDEEDPTPAERTWIVGVQPPTVLIPQGPPIKLWKIE